MGLNDKAIATTAATAKPPVATPPITHPNQQGIDEVASKALSALTEWFIDKELDINDPSHKVQIVGRVEYHAGIPDKDGMPGRNTTPTPPSYFADITFWADGHDFVAVYPRRQFEVQSLNLSIDIVIAAGPLSAGVRQYSRNRPTDGDIMLANTLNEISLALLTERCNKVIATKHRRFNNFCAEHNLPCTTCRQNTLTKLHLSRVVTGRIEDRRTFEGCANCHTGIYKKQ